jgi:amidophosphoribosyltransferase
MEDRLHHKCGIFGIYGKNLDVGKLTYFGLFALQHRGQESSGISVSNSKRITTHKGIGLVAQIYTEQDFKKLKGFIAIGHNRYSTSGSIHDAHIQPVSSKHDIVALAHNGNLPVTKTLENFLSSKGFFTKGLNDSELMHQVIRYYLVKGVSLEEAVRKSFPLFTGSFCLLVMTKNKLVAVRDSCGIRPFSLGKLNGGYVFSSETCAIDTINADFIRDVNPGEMIVVGPKGIKSYQLAKPTPKLDIFEFVYFCRPDSVILGKRVHEIRKNLGIELGKECKIKADVVIPVPDSSIPAAIGYSSISGIPFDFGLVKNRYIGRTFILPEQRLRDRGVQMKLNPISDIIKGKRVIVIDDSIVRGTTLKKLVAMLRDAGAYEVHILISCPPVKFPDFYGIDTPSQKELIASHKTVLQIEKHIGADSLYFLSYKGLIKAVGLPESIFCTSCFTGNYPISIGKHANKIKTPASKM